MVGELQAARGGGHQGASAPFNTKTSTQLTRDAQRTRAGELHITPKASENEWYRWLEGIQDWCISRQLWWGHRCPAYFVRIAGAKQDVRAGTKLLTNELT